MSFSYPDKWIGGEKEWVNWKQLIDWRLIRGYSGSEGRREGEERGVEMKSFRVGDLDKVG